MVELVATINDRTYTGTRQVDFPSSMLTTGLTISVIAVGPYPSILLACISILYVEPSVAPVIVVVVVRASTTLFYLLDDPVVFSRHY